MTVVEIACRLRGLAVIGAIACSAVCIPSRGLADAAQEGLKTIFTIDDENPESSVPTPKEAMRAPLEMGYWVMIVSDRAEAAIEAGNLAAAVKYYRAIAKAGPDRAVGYRKMCVVYEMMHDWKNAVENCRIALGKGGVNADDSARFVRLLLAKDGPLVATEVADADAVIGHLQKQLVDLPPEPTDTKGGRIFVEGLKCELGLRLEDQKRLAACSSALRAAAPRDPKTIAFAFAAALMEHDFDQAQRLIDDAKKAGVNDTGVTLMQGRLRSELDRRPLFRRVLDDKRPIAIAGALLALGAAVAFLARRKFGLRTARV